jgi:hypothetical protein
VVCWRLGCRASVLGMKVVYIAGDDIDCIGQELLFLNVKIARLVGDDVEDKGKCQGLL